MKVKEIIILTLALLLFQFSYCQKESNVVYSADYKAVHAAISDYVEGLYLVDTSRIARSVHPELRKRGYWYSEEKGKFMYNSDMSFQQLKNLSARWNQEGDSADSQSPKIIEIYDINSKTASAKLIAGWGMDYFHLAKIEDKWYIMNVLWQSLPD